MRKAAKQIIVCALGLVVICLICRFAFFNRFSLYVPVSELSESAAGAEKRPGDGPTEAPEIIASADRPEIARTGETEIRDRYARIPVYPGEKGETDLQIRAGNGDRTSMHVLYVDRFQTVYDRNTGNYTGDTVVLVATTVFWLVVCAIMVWHFMQARGAAFYQYGSIYYAGFSLFALATGLVMLSVTVSHVLQPADYSMYSAYSAIAGACSRYMTMTAPLMLLFAGAMAVSNIELLRHERPGPQNGLGLLVAALLVIGEAVGWYLYSRDFSGSETMNRVHDTLKNTYATIFVYFQCMLIGAVICGISAARHVPALDRAYIIILGCWFRKDGTLPPLLRGRADRALAFWREQKEKTGREACFIPSGGQGEDETMPEAEAIRNYLKAQGVPDRLILTEKQSANTYQNMTFSRKIIEETDPRGKAVFATSSYHVFRSGVLAHQTGLNAEGIGSKTKWWYWPNAFMRETVGLLQRRWKQELLFLALLIAFFGALSMILG